MSFRTFYEFDPATGLFLGAGSFQENPHQPGEYIRPENTTDIAPPGSVSENAVHVWNGAEWLEVPDHRGETWYDTDGAPVAISQPGDPAEAGYTAAPPPPTLDELKAAKLTEIAARIDEEYALGYPVTSPANGDSPFTLQIRNDTDRTNWLTAARIYDMQVAAGFGATAGATIRSAGNTNHIYTFSDAAALLSALAQHGAAIQRNGWALLDAARAAANEPELDAIDLEVGWPVV